MGTDVAEGKGHTRVPDYAASYFFDGGYNYNYGPQKKLNNLLTVYANYGHYFEEAKSNVDATIGYDYQYWKSTSPATTEYNMAGAQLKTHKAEDYRHKASGR